MAHNKTYGSMDLLLELLLELSLVLLVLLLLLLPYVLPIGASRPHPIIT